jgi:2-oxoglutarate dehydrogenase E2 component (dihydrolipoamide succinyltransferase)
MATPVTLETLVGYVVAEDVYVSYSEYYGDGTIYGRVDLLTPDGNPVKGEGKTKADLMNAGVVLSENPLGTVTGDLVAVPNDAAPAAEETPAPAAEETPAPPAEETPAPAPAVEETPVPAPACKCSCNCCSCCSATPAPAPEDNRYTVSLSMMGFEVTREFTAKIDLEARRIYLS